jgi:hypothetical protein
MPASRLDDPAQHPADGVLDRRVDVPVELFEREVKLVDIVRKRARNLAGPLGQVGVHYALRDVTNSDCSARARPFACMRRSGELRSAHDEGEHEGGMGDVRLRQGSPPPPQCDLPVAAVLSAVLLGPGVQRIALEPLHLLVRVLDTGEVAQLRVAELKSPRSRPGPPGRA